MIEEDIEKNLELVKKSQNKVIEDASKIKKLQSNFLGLLLKINANLSGRNLTDSGQI